MIRLAGASWHWPTGGSVGPVDLTVAAGEFVVLTGPTGCGKSTVLRMAAGLLQRHGLGSLAGEVTVAGTAPGALVAGDRVQALGFVAQDPDDQIVTGSVAAEVAFSLESAGWRPEAMQVRVREVLLRVGMAGFAARSPHHLSGGQRQRLMVGAAVAAGARVLLLDEPLAQLDPAGAAEVTALLREVARSGVAVLLVEHRLEAVWECVDRVVVMNHGCVIADPLGEDDTLSRLGLRPPAMHELRRLRSGLVSHVAAKGVETRCPTVEGGAHEAAIASIEGVTAGYPACPGVLSAASLSIRTGERVALVGPNGSGKSTLLRALAGLGIESGRRVVTGRVVDVPQNPDLTLFSPTVRDELAYGPVEHHDPDVDATVRNTAAALSVADLLERPPQALSRGQRLRVAVAAALTCRPSLLLLDEPTSGQDGDQVDRMFAGLIASLSGALVFACHDLDVVLRHATRVVVLDAGRVVGDGSPLPTLAASMLPLPALARYCIDRGVPYGTPAEVASRC